MKKKDYRTLLFDVDGTLLDFHGAERDGLGQVLLARGVSPTAELEQRYREINNRYWRSFERGEISRDEIMGNRFVDFFRTLGIAVEGQEEERIFRTHLDLSAYLLEGAMEICEYLKQHYRMYIVTNGVSDTQYKRLAISGLDQYFNEVFVSEDTGSHKPHKEFFDYCFARIPDAKLEDMLIIGDTLSSDIKGGNAAGIDTCWYNPDKLARKAGVRVDYEIRKLIQLKEFL